MAKDHRWEDQHYHQQDEWERQRAEEFQHRCQAESEGRVCPVCDNIIDPQYITTRTEKETKYFDGPLGGGTHTTTVIEWHIEEIKCPRCGWQKERRRWKDKSPWEKFTDWLKDLFS